MKKLILISVLLAALAAPLIGEAAVPRGAFRLSFDTTFFRFGVGEREYDGREQNFDAATFGIGMPSYGVGFGGAVTDNVVIGGRLTMGLEGYDHYHQDADGFVWQVLPYVEYVFLAGIFRPFVMGILGFQGRGDLDEMGDDSWWGFTAGGGGGFHLFFFSNLSLDVTLAADYTVGTGETPRNQDFGHWRFTFGALVGLSGWFG